jgi:mRNA-degrading endonuclease toxin of MazEF toxin-antitoxin module
VSDERFRRGEIWWIDFPHIPEPSRHPGLVVSSDRFNDGNTGTVFVVPITTEAKLGLGHIAVEPKQSGLPQLSFFKVEQLTFVEKEFLVSRAGYLDGQIMMRIETQLYVYLGLPRPR